VNLLLDTCTFLWLVSDPPKLSPTARETLISPSHRVFLSSVSCSEIAIKYVLGRLSLAAPPARFIPVQRDLHRVESLSLDEAAALHVSRLPALHRDPFDRLLVCQALVHGLTILTPDEAVSQYGAPTLW
jgi:PIN domain nuclease of toxin-antitoxin system